MIKAAKRKIGLSPIDFDDVKYFLKEGHDLDLNSQENKAGREAAALDFLENELKLLPK